MEGGGKRPIDQHTPASLNIVPHPRTFRKAREQVKYRVIDEVSPRQIKNYLHRFPTWWVKTSNVWVYHELLQQFMDVCWDSRVTAIAQDIAQHDHLREVRISTEVPRSAAACA